MPKYKIARLHSFLVFDQGDFLSKGKKILDQCSSLVHCYLQCVLAGAVTFDCVKEEYLFLPAVLGSGCCAATMAKEF